MTVDLAALIAANKALQSDSHTTAATRRYAEAATAALQAIVAALPPVSTPNVPPPVATGSGVGLTMYAGKLDTCSHTQDGTYEVVNADIQDAALLGKVSGLGFAYFNTLPTDAVHVNLADPAGFVSQVRASQAQYGYDGVFLDNCSGANPAYKSGQLLSFLRAIQPLRPVCQIQLNVAGYGLHGDGRDDNGTSQCEMAAALAGLADYMMCENWQQITGSSYVPPGSLRYRGTSASYQWWDQWQAVIPAIHAAGARAVCLTYGWNVGIVNAIYGRASMLLAGAQPGDVFMYSPGSSPSGPDPYSTAWVGPALNPTVSPVPPVSATL